MAKKTRFIKEFGARVRDLREEQGLSQEKLADIAHLHRTAITHIERATRSSTLETIEKLAKALGVQPADLMPDLELSRRRAKK
jgi:transcriptional regulator with XRE-family HTH domain